MIIGKDRKVTYAEFSVNLTKEEEEKFLNYARKNIVNDKDWLLNYVFNKALTDRVEKIKNSKKKSCKKTNKYV